MHWKTNVIWTAFLCPGSIFGVFFVCNLFLWGRGSSAAVPFGTLIALLAMWIFISIPLTFVGAFFGFKKPVRSCVSVTQSIRGNECAAAPASRAHESDPASSAGADDVHTTTARHADGRCTAVRLHIHSALLHTQQYLVSVIHVAYMK